nr:LysR family transcriptional regulator [Salinisphaera halophila]
MELRHLRYFQTVARELNITRASEKLYMAQPPLSRQIRQLETELGTPLFDRTSHGLTLTEAGKYFVKHTNTILEQVEAAIAGTRALAKASDNALRIGFVPSFLYEELPTLIQRLRARHDISLTLTELMTVDQIYALKTNRIDIGFGRLVIDDPEVHQEVMFEEPLIAVLPTEHHLVGSRPTLAALAVEPLIVYPEKPRPSYADIVLEQFRSRNIQVKVAQQANGLQTAIGLVASGMGFTLVPERVQRMGREGVAFCALGERDITSPVLASMRREPTSATLAELLSILHELVKGSHPLMRTLQGRLIMGRQKECYATQDVQRRIQGGSRRTRAIVTKQCARGRARPWAQPDDAQPLVSRGPGLVEAGISGQRHAT